MSNHSSEEEEREGLDIKCRWALDKCHGTKRAMSGRQKVKNQKRLSKDFPGDPVVKNLPANAGDMGSIPGLGRFHVPRGNQAHVSQLLSPCPKTCAPQQDKPPQ